MMPSEHLVLLATFDAVIVPSTFCKGAIDADWENVHVVPHCFDEDYWDLTERTLQPEATYRFYSLGAWGERKNMLGLVKAYLAEFTKRDAVQLLLVIDRPDFGELRSLLARSGLPPEVLPELHVPDREPLTEEELAELHATADCFVTATRGEGFGLGMFEAAICGREVIAPAFGGQLDFLDTYAGFRSVPSRLTPCFGGDVRWGKVVDGNMVQATVSLPPGLSCHQLWAEPDLVALGKAMRSAYQQKDVRTQQQRRTDRAALEARFGYKVVGPQLANLLKGLAWQANSGS